MRRTVPVVVAAISVVVLAAVGFGVGWLAHREPTPEAAAVVQQLAAMLEGPHAGSAQYEDAVAAAGLFAADAKAVDGPSGQTVEGSDAIQAGFQDLFAQGGSWEVDHVFAKGRWGLVVATRTMTDADGATVTARWGILLRVEDGQIVSEYDLYDAASIPF